MLHCTIWYICVYIYPLQPIKNNLSNKVTNYLLKNDHEFKSRPLCLIKNV